MGYSASPNIILNKEKPRIKDIWQLNMHGYSCSTSYFISLKEAIFIGIY